MKTPLFYLKPEEIEAMPMVALEVSKSIIVNKETNTKREAYLATVKYDRLHKFKINISSDEFALLHYLSEREKVENNFEIQVHARIVETQWPEKDGRKAHSSYEIQVYVDEDIGYKFNITDTYFMTAFLKGLKKGKLKGYEPLVRLPGKLDKEEKAVEPSDLQDLPEETEEVPPEEEAEKLPF